MPGQHRTGAYPTPGGIAALDQPDHTPPPARRLEATGTPPAAGPFAGDEDEPSPGLTDFGSVRIPMPAGGSIAEDPTSPDGPLQAVHIAVPAGRLSVSALAAPKTAGLWPDLAKEIDASLREAGTARVRSFTGEWGRELHATTDAATSLFLGVDGPRWMLYGVATGPTGTAAELAEELRRLLRATVVVRGRLPYPVRTVLPLAVPAELAGAASTAGSGSGAEVASAGSAD